MFPVSTIDQVLALALTGPLTPIEWTDSDDIVAAAAKADEGDSDAVITH